MSKPVLIGAVLGTIGVAAGGTIATYSLMDHGPDCTEVIAIQPVKETIKAPCQVCKDVAVTRQHPVKDQYQIAGTAIGAVIGGLLGNQIGGGIGKKIATVAGAIGDGYAGNRVQEGVQERDTYTTTETRCSTVHNSSEKVVGYDAKYVLGDKAGQIRVERDPGNQIPIDKDDRLILNQGETLC